MEPVVRAGRPAFAREAAGLLESPMNTAVESVIPPPPGPRRRPGAFERVLAAFVAAVGCAVFVIAVVLNPYDEQGRPRTQGTHRQLGLPACVVLSTVGLPCPSCGMTTSVSLLVQGDFRGACRANWAGVIIAGCGFAATAWLGLLAVGIPRAPRLSAENTILALAVAGAAAALVRYAAVVGIRLIAVAS